MSAAEFQGGHMVGYPEALKLFWLRQIRMPCSVRHVSGPRHVTYARDELVVVTLVRNAEVYIDTFVAHYLELGARHIYVLDNGSSDRTVELASRLSRVSVFYCSLPFRDFNLLMRQYLVRRFGNKNRWILCVDIDELFDYPYSDRIDLRSFLTYLNQRQYTTVVAYLLEMFSELPLSHLDEALGDLKTRCRYFDISSIRKSSYPQRYPDHGYTNRLQQQQELKNTLSNPAIKLYTGGIRASCFDLQGVYLIKHPLVFVDGKSELVHQHFVNQAHVADITAVLYHYKFVAGFRCRVKDALLNRQYWAESVEYLNYDRVLEADGDARLISDTSRVLRSVNDLVDAEFLQVTPEYSVWCEERCS